jgi:hypothetical protein
MINYNTFNTLNTPFAHEMIVRSYHAKFYEALQQLELQQMELWEKSLIQTLDNREPVSRNA